MDVLYLHQKTMKSCLLFLAIAADKAVEVMFTKELIRICRIT